MYGFRDYLKISFVLTIVCGESLSVFLLEIGLWTHYGYDNCCIFLSQN